MSSVDPAWTLGVIDSVGADAGLLDRVRANILAP